MFRRFFVWTSHIWGVLCEFLVPPSTPISQTPSISASNAMPYTTKYDVFLSFHGKDTGLNFTGHLYDKLESSGIPTFMDDPELRGGQVMSDALRDAIRKSKTYIVVLSENYASSSLCLEELAEILKCRKEAERWVVPVYYNVEPSVVRQAFKKHQVRLWGKRERVKNWQLTLKEVTDLSGFLTWKDRSEADVINEIVDELLRKINPKTLDVTRYPVGLDARVKDMTSLLSSETEGVIKFGIYGTSGVGKSTLAKALYNQLLGGRSFEGSCFLANVRETEWTAKGLVSLQEQLINDVLNCKHRLELRNVERGIKIIEERICSKKILVLIDDLEDPQQFWSLVGPFASGSVIIITTRDEEILDYAEVHPRFRYMVHPLDIDDSLTLFAHHAFGDGKPNDTLKELSKEILEHAGGLPLALKVFGSNLANQSEQGWRWFISLLKRRYVLTIKDRDDLLRYMGREVCSVFELMTSTSSQNPFSFTSYETPTPWDVFVSFHGEDTRFKFTGHMYAALDRYGIRTYKDDPELHIGDVITDALVRAIQESKTYIVVLSENYASSGWCLDELQEICHCSNTMKRAVIPVFYNIDPSVARHQTGSYELAFEKHKVHFPRQMQKLKNWRLALEKVANFSGYHISAKSSEADIIDQIVGEILLKIDLKALGVAKYPVGLDSRVEGITAKLSDTEGVTKIGIYGMGGMGKTTLAKALYNQILRGGSFKDSCFLAEVREVSKTSKGLVSLQKQIINDVLKSKKKVEFYNVEDGIKAIRERICSAKILLIIDDINDLKQYEYLVGPFASGSVVIITTRDEEILDKIHVEATYRYRVNMLDKKESLALFTQHAFPNAKPNDALMELSEDILRLAGGLPLALEVFGSYLSSKQSIEGWKAYMKSLLQSPSKTIQQKLIISLDALESEDPKLKKLFLDIACFFTGRRKEEVVKIMETYYSYVDHRIDILEKRCLLNLNNRSELGMHDLLRDIGRDIVRNGCPYEPGKHSRLWVLKDIYNVLRNKEGPDVIEGIISDNFYYQKLKAVSFTTESFKRMSKLRFLYLNNVNLTGSFEQTFEDLRWLCWECCPLKCLPSEFYPEKLVILELRRSTLRTMCNVSMPISQDDQVYEYSQSDQVFENLRIINMSSSLYLRTTLDFTRVPCLETLNLEGCQSLEEVHTSIGSLLKLVSLNLCGCVKLKSLPDTICNLRALKSLNIADCSSVKSLPREMGNIESLERLHAWGLTVSHIPHSISRLSKLVTLILRNNNNLETLPDKFGDLRALETLDFRNCCRLLSIKELPPNVKWILADNCTSMEILPNVSHLKSLETFHVTNCSSLTCIRGLKELSSLKKLSLGGCNSSLLAYAFTEHLFQTFSGFGHRIEIHIQSEDFPDWISRSSNLGTTVSVDLAPCMSHNLLALILCFKLCEDTEMHLLDDLHTSCEDSEIHLHNDLHPSYYNVQNITSGFMLQFSFDNHNHESLMVIVPRSIFSVKGGDGRIEITSDAEILGIHLMCGTD